MCALCRLCVVWLLAVGLPLQSLSMSAMRVCAVGAEVFAPSVAHGHGHGLGHGHGAVQARGVHGCLSEPMALPSALPCHAAHGGTVHGHKSGVLTCDGCVACCAATPLATASLSFERVELHSVDGPETSAVTAVFLTQGIERPPRPPLA